jgi:hypothetical protein
MDGCSKWLGDTEKTRVEYNALSVRLEDKDDKVKVYMND